MHPLPAFFALATMFIVLQALLAREAPTAKTPDGQVRGLLLRGTRGQGGCEGHPAPLIRLCASEVAALGYS